MKLCMTLLILISSGCATNRQIIKDPFGFKTQWQEGSTKTRSIDDEVEIVFPANEFGPTLAGFNWSANIEPKDEYTISYEVKFADGFDFVKGGKLPGLCGGHGRARIRPQADDKLSARIMWRKDGRVVSYVYHPDQKEDYGDDFQWNSTKIEPLHFKPNKWEKVRFTVKLNSPRQYDGSIIGYFNNIEALKKTDFRFRDSNDLKIDKLCFNTFFGGNDKSWSPEKEQRLFIRSLIIE